MFVNIYICFTLGEPSKLKMSQIVEKVPKGGEGVVSGKINIVKCRLTLT